jgi:hypothetical protein
MCFLSKDNIVVYCTVLSLCGEEKVLQNYVILMYPIVKFFLSFFSATLLSITMLLMLII